jgi:hypothetical protein
MGHGTQNRCHLIGTAIRVGTLLDLLQAASSEHVDANAANQHCYLLTKLTGVSKDRTAHAAPPAPARALPAAWGCLWGRPARSAAPGWAPCRTLRPQSVLWGPKTCGMRGKNSRRKGDCPYATHRSEMPALLPGTAAQQLQLRTFASSCKHALPRVTNESYSLCKCRCCCSASPASMLLLCPPCSRLDDCCMHALPVQPLAAKRGQQPRVDVKHGALVGRHQLRRDQLQPDQPGRTGQQGRQLCCGAAAAEVGAWCSGSTCSCCACSTPTSLVGGLYSMHRRTAAPSLCHDGNLTASHSRRCGNFASDKKR